MDSVEIVPIDLVFIELFWHCFAFHDFLLLQRSSYSFCRVKLDWLKLNSFSAQSPLRIVSLHACTAVDAFDWPAISKDCLNRQTENLNSCLESSCYNY